MAEPLPYRLMHDRAELTLVATGGEIVARFPPSQRRLAETVARLPILLDLFHQILDGVDGYLSECGEDGRYWSANVVDRAWAVLEASSG